MLQHLRARLRAAGAPPAETLYAASRPQRNRRPSSAVTDLALLEQEHLDTMVGRKRSRTSRAVALWEDELDAEEALGSLSDE